MRLPIPQAWRVPVLFTAIALGVLVYDAVQPWFWQRAHDIAPLAGALLLVLLGLLLLRRRFAWWIFVALSGSELATTIAHVSMQRVTTGWLVGGFLGLIQLALLVSPSMRHFVQLRRSRPAIAA